MKINEIEMQYQIKEDCRNVIMTLPIYQRYMNGDLKDKLDPDYIVEWGCFNCAGVNIYNHYHGHYLKDGKYLTIEQFVKLMKEKKGYEYDYWMDFYKGDIDKVKKACEGNEANSRQEVFDEILGIKSRDNDYKGAIEISVPNFYYIIKTPYSNTGHYSMLLDSNYRYFDSYDGKIKTASNFLKIIKVIL